MRETSWGIGSLTFFPLDNGSVIGYYRWVISPWFFGSKVNCTGKKKE